MKTLWVWTCLIEMPMILPMRNLGVEVARRCSEYADMEVRVRGGPDEVFSIGSTCTADRFTGLGGQR